MSHPSTITGCRDIQRNGKWRSNINVKWRIVNVSLNISASSGHRRIKLPPFVAAWWGGSNELRYILLRSLDVEIIDILICFEFESVQFDSVQFSLVQFSSVLIQFQIRSVSSQIRSVQISLSQISFKSNQFQIRSVLNQIRSNQI